MSESQTANHNGELKELIREVRLLEKQLKHLPGWGAGIPAGGGAVLQELLAYGDQTVPQIGRRRGTSRQNIQVLVNGLKAEGWVEMTPNPAHRRSELVRLTAKGRDIVEKLAQEEAVFLEGLSTQMSAETVSSASGVLRQVRDLIGGKMPRPEAKPQRREPKQEVPVPKAEAPKAPAESKSSEAEEGELPVSLL